MADVMTMPSLEETTVEQAFSDLDNEISLTDKAYSEVKKIMEANKIPETYGLRVGVKGGGCSGLSYSLGFDFFLRKNHMARPLRSAAD